MLYITPELYIADSAAIQQAVNTAAEKDIRTVVIPGTKVWQLDAPVRLPGNVTLILDGAQIETKGIAFTNANAEAEASLGNEQANIHLLGIRGAAITGGTEPQIALKNVRDFTIRGIAFAGGAGVELRHCRYGKVQQLQFTGSRHGIFLGEGCNNLLLGDIRAETEQEAVIWSAGNTAVWGRSNNIYDSVLYRLDAKTAGAPAVALHAGAVIANNLFFRDITDRTKTGVAVQLGGEDATQLLDLSVRNVATARTAVSVSDNCDGVYLGNLQTNAIIAADATRVLEEDCPEAVALPQFPETAVTEFVDANAFAGGNDWETLQNALNAAAGKCLVIPRHNRRTGDSIWNIEKTLVVPSDTTVILLDAHLRLADFTYCNLLTNAPGARNIRILGVGSATLDSGKFNGLKLKNAGTLGFGPITDNALLRFAGVEGLTVENLHMVQNRWYCILCVGCAKGRLADLDICAHPNFPDMGGIRIHSGCREMQIENITGLTGEDAVVLEASGATGSISHICIRTVKVNASRCSILRILTHEGGCVKDIFAETLLDVSLPEQKKLPFATARIGDTDSENIFRITLRDLNGRSHSTVQLGGSSENIAVSNIHSYGSSDNALATLPLPESRDYHQLRAVLIDLAELDRGFRANVKHLHAKGLFFRCTQGSRYMRGTATSIITNKKKFLGTVADLRNFRGEDIVIEDVLAERIGNGIRVTGNASVEVRDFRAAQIGREEAVCGGNCRLTVNGETVPVTAVQSL